MGLAAAKIGLELNNRITGLTGQATDGTHKQVAKALGEKRASEKLDRVFVFGGNGGVVDKRNLP